jgi:hypothetical protein
MTMAISVTLPLGKLGVSAIMAILGDTRHSFKETPEMRKHSIFPLAVLALAVFLGSVRANAADAQAMLSHDVFFSLKDHSPQAKQKLIAACKKYLTDHPGTVRFAVGPRAEEMKRDVNDRDFDVALHIVFENKAAHDQYATAERHQKFIEETQHAWKKVRVFDSYVEE